MKYLLGIDVSTTATKTILIDEQGKVAGVSATEYGFETPYPLWSEQDPPIWWYGAIQSMRRMFKTAGVDPRDVAAIGLTGQMHGLVPLNEAGSILRPAILWNDQRTAAQCDEIRTRVGKERLIRVTGNDALAGFTAPKILWMREHEPEIWEQVRTVLLPKDYMRFLLTHHFATDKADGSGTLLMDLRTRDWSPEILRDLDIPRSYLPHTAEGTEITGYLTRRAAQDTGLPEGTPVIAGGGDQAAQAVGVGAVCEGIVALTLGTSGVVFATVDKPYYEPEGRLHAFCHSVPGRWHLMGVMLSAAGSLRWFRDTFAPGTGYDELLAPAAKIPIGSEGLIFLPYLTGERTPHPDPLARGAFVGLTVRHTLAHMTRAVLEGVAFGLRDSFELMKSAGLPAIRQVRISGGGAVSPLWRQILADVLGVDLVTVNTNEGAGYGAALLAGVGIGMWPTVDAACDAVVRITGSTQSDDRATAAYESFYGIYRDLYPALRSTFQRLGGDYSGDFNGEM